MNKKIAALLATAGLLSVTAPTEAATIPVFGWSGGFTTCFNSCFASVPGSGGNLIEPTPAGYQAPGLGFNTQMVWNYDGGNPAGPATFSVSGLPAHSSLNLGFLLAIIDSWDGSTPAGGTTSPDYLNISVDGVLVYSQTYDNFLTSDQSASTANQLSFGSNLGFNPGWNDSAYDFTGVNALLNIPHTASSATVGFFASGAGWQGGGDESFGLDKITMSINTADQVPEPGSLALLGLGLATLAARRRSAKA
ncbi:PEP-CTERM sorting domain-containing protein [Accumulibacter sp.]|uniref:PEP-CTERM sorting domain-containing protein n=1 Tax=Accumulibacter sp. TaxID=2053492 RepID=UPI0025EF3444|nr:PEP-CTERM sorting domain-containing protein [Accumulibacter sp.]MCM8593792.1 PEP-CTERM sorting domain-containing protein [Accumulibacter sp.]MDS4047933.1 PEP-CTERM sorting domain-containing protein [Accumulibacter sp.]